MRERIRAPKSVGFALVTPVLALLALLCLVTGKPAASGPTAETVLYQEDFEDGQAQNWAWEGDWEIVKGSQSNWVLRGRGHNMARYSGDAWGDYSFRLRLKLVRGRIHLNYRVGNCTRYFIGFDEQGIDLNRTAPCGTHKQLRAVSQAHSTTKWYEVTISGSGGGISVYVNGSRALSFTDSTPLLYGTIALEALDGAEVYVDDVTVLGQPSAAIGMAWVKTGGPLGGLGYDVRMRPGNPDIMYVTDAWSGANVSSDGGATWHASNEGIFARTGSSGDAIPIFSLTIDPQNHDVIWAGAQGMRGIFRSSDAGKTWVQKDKGVRELHGISFRGFTVDPSDPNTVYAACEISSFAWTEDGATRIGREFDLTKGVVYRTTDGGESWTQIWRGDNLARYVWIDPRDSDTIYVSTGIFDREAANSDARTGSPGGVGILKSTDGGRTWQTLGRANGLKNLYVGSLFMHPTNPDTLLAAAGVNSYRDGGGVYLTTDGGQTWRQTLQTGFTFTAVEFSVSDPRIAYAGSELGLYRSEDGGQTWHPITATVWGPPGVRAGIPIDFQVDPADPNRIFVNNYGGGNFLSEDGGQTWSVASHGYTGAQLRDIAVDPGDSARVYVIGRTGPFRSFDSGGTWEGLNYGAATFPEWYALAMDPKDANNLLISDEFNGTLLRSTNGGLDWVRAYTNPFVAADSFGNRHGFKAIAFSPSDSRVVYAGMCRQTRYIDEGRNAPSFGVFRSTDGGSTWQEANDARTEGQNINALAVDPQESAVVYAGTVQSGVLKSEDGGKSWRPMNAGLQVLDIRALSIDPRNTEILYAGAENGGVYRSSDGGQSWRTGSAGMDPQAAVRDIVIDPTNTQVLYAADLRTGVYRSQDGAQTWNKVNLGLRTRAVTALAISTDGTAVYAATDGEGVFRLDLTPAGG
jgi:photosystem II stability/assembly factor-like uncharacterized protein